MSSTVYITAEQTKKDIIKAFQKKTLTLRPQSLESLQQFIQKIFNIYNISQFPISHHIQQIITNINQIFLHTPDLRSNVIDDKIMQDAIKIYDQILTKQFRLQVSLSDDKFETKLYTTANDNNNNDYFASQAQNNNVKPSLQQNESDMLKKLLLKRLNSSIVYLQACSDDFPHYITTAEGQLILESLRPKNPLTTDSFENRNVQKQIAIGQSKTEMFLQRYFTIRNGMILKNNYIFEYEKNAKLTIDAGSNNFQNANFIQKESQHTSTIEEQVQSLKGSAKKLQQSSFSKDQPQIIDLETMQIEPPPQPYMIDLTQLQQKIQSTVFPLCEIGSLLGAGPGIKCTVGMLIEINQVYFLENNHHRFRLDLSEVLPTYGFIITNCVVIVKGVVLEQCLKAIELVHPQFDSRMGVFELYGEQDYFGAVTKIDKSFGKLINLEINQKAFSNNSTSNINQTSKSSKHDVLTLEAQKGIGIYECQNLICSNISIDGQNASHNQEDVTAAKQPEFMQRPVVVIQKFLLIQENLEKFDGLLSQFKLHNVHPLMFLLIGEFFPFPEITNQCLHNEVTSQIEKLAAIICKYPLFQKKSFWVMVPSLHDIGNGMLPRQGLPTHLIDILSEKLTYFINATNPSRFSILGKQFMICKTDIMKHLRNYAVTPVSAQIDIQDHMLRTILCQRHLSPVDLYKNPIYWTHDSDLRITQLPHFLILADNYCDSYAKVVFGAGGRGQPCVVINPGNFSQNSIFQMIFPLIDLAYSGKNVEEIVQKCSTI